MPLDSTIPQETPVFARQVGGRTIDSGSPLWKTLFPSELLRIDGRVPTDKSSQFLLQMRMTSAKELIAVAFSPASAEGDAGFRILMDFLIAKK
jgi:SPOC domain